MLGYNLHTLALGKVLKYYWERVEKKGQYTYGIKVKGGCVQGDNKQDLGRRVLADISGNARPNMRP